MKWSDVKVRQLPEIQRLIEFQSTDMVEILDRDVTLLSIITGKSEDYFLSLNSKDFGGYRKPLYELISTQPTKGFEPVFTFAGRKFSTVVSGRQVGVDQLADIHLLHIDGKNYYSNLHLILAVFAREQTGWKFWKKKLSFSEKAELFKDVPADVANSISLFFCTASPKFETLIRNYLEKEIHSKVSKLTETLKQSSIGGDGSARSTNSRTETSQRKRRTTK